MKENLEDIFKQALNDFELPYENGAWESFQTHLKPVNTKPSLTKWLWGGGSAAFVAGLGIFFYVNQSTPSTTKSATQVTTAPSKKSEENRKSDKNTDKNTILTASNNTTTDKNRKTVTTQNNNAIELVVQDAIPKDYLEKHNYQPEVTKSDKTIEVSHDNSFVNTNKDNTNQETLDNFKVPRIENQCKGETLRLENSNAENLGIKSPSGKLSIIYPGAKSDITLNEVGTYEIGKVSHFDNNFIAQASFKVQSVPNLQLSVDDQISYDNGLPIIKTEANSSEENITWKADKQAKGTLNSKGKNAEYTFFRKGQYEIVAQTTNGLGCKTQESKTITVAEDYNLLAVNAFDPNSLDSRKNTFIPFALKVRNTPFRMVIIDPDNGGIVFETTDASQGWDGIDRRDGKLVNPNKTFMWKVTLSQPEAGEKPEYKGTIIRI